MNRNTYCKETIYKQTNKAKIAYKQREDCIPEEEQQWKVYDMHGYQQITCAIIFDVKMYVTWKGKFLANSSKTEAPVSLTYSSTVSRDSVRIELFIAEMNDLDVMACDIGNAYLNALCKENIWFKAGAECGEHQGKVMIMV